MPRYHFVVREADHTHDDPEGVHLPNHDAAKDHGSHIVRELKDGGYCPSAAQLPSKCPQDLKREAAAAWR